MLTLKTPSQETFNRWFELSTNRQAVDRAWVSGGDLAEERKQLDAMIPQLLPNGKDTPEHVFRTAQDEEGQDVAFVWFGSLPGQPPEIKLLFDIYVEPVHRRNGYAREILTAMLDELAAEGVRDVFLNARGDNEPALALYEQLGFDRTTVSEDGKQIELSKALPPTTA
ncbi:GNAT family N-acetyltransferase [Candidatus Bipolaricaulota bacterium]